MLCPTGNILTSLPPSLISSNLIHDRVQENFSLEVMVTSVSPHSAVARAGLRPGHVLTTINNWQLEAMQVVESVQTVLLAGGFFITLGWLETSDLSQTENNWTPLGTF